MKNKLASFRQELFTLIKTNPIELLVAFTFFVLAVLKEEGYFYYHLHSSTLQLFPLLILIPYILNRKINTYPYRILYLISYGIFIPFLFTDLASDLVHSTGYYYYLLITFLLFVSYKMYKDNLAFAKEAVKNVINLFSAFLISLAFFLLTIAIYISFTYIFNLNTQDQFYIYTLFFSMFFITSFCFLYFDQFLVNRKFESSGIFTVLLNFLISPALIIYTVILYIYFARILIIWELPKGNVAYMVFGFILFLVIGKVCQLLLVNRYYDWFYKSSSFISLPLLCMFWVGVCYRLNEYGVTENRIYLIAAGIVITLFALLFLFPKTSHYIYVTTTGIILFSLVTFIPWISARHLDNKYRIRETISYEEYIGKPYYSDIVFYKNGYNICVDISGYKTYYGANGNDIKVNEELYKGKFEEKTGTFSFVSKNDTLASFNINANLKQVADKYNISLKKDLEKDHLEPYKDDFMIIRTDQMLVYTDRIKLVYDEKEEVYKVDWISINFIVIK